MLTGRITNRGPVVLTTHDAATFAATARTVRAFTPSVSIPGLMESTYNEDDVLISGATLTVVIFIKGE